MNQRFVTTVSNLLSIVDELVRRMTSDLGFDMKQIPTKGTEGFVYFRQFSERIIS